MRSNIIRRDIKRLLLVSLGLFCFSFFIYARLFPYSLFSFYWDDLAGEAHKHDLAQHYLSSLKTSLFTTNRSADLCVAIPSAYRQVPYIFRSLASVALSTQECTGCLIKAAVLDTTSNRGKLCTNYLADLSFFTSLQCVSHTTNQKYEDDWVHKERLDYADTLDFCLETSDSKYILLLQDDAILARNALELLVSLQHEFPSDLQVLQLYSSDFWKGFELDKHFAYFLLLAVCGFVFGQFLVFRTPYHGIFFAIWFPLGILIAGKQHLPLVGTPVSGGVVRSKMEGPGIVGYMYERNFAAKVVVPTLRAGCNKRECPVDLFVDSLVEFGYELLPNVVDHVGFVSSNANKRFYDYFHPHHVRSGSFRKSMGSPF